jgi:TonB dependent receptor
MRAARIAALEASPPVWRDGIVLGNFVQAKWLVAAAIAALMSVSAAQAQDAASGVLTYGPDFFAALRPSTAYDMIGRLPGFTFSDVGSARGFAGTAGNVLINGQRPTSKSDSLQSILSRIPASNVDHIELIRGGAPGIDMQGQTVVANIVLKTADSTTWVANTDNVIFIDGHSIPSASLQFTQHSGASTYEGSIGSIQSYDDSVGHGFHNVYDGAGHLLSHDFAISHGLGVGFQTKGAATVPLFGGEFKANLTYQNSPWIDRLSYQRPGFLELFKDDSRDNTGELGLHWKGKVGADWELETLVLQRLAHNNSASDADDTVTLQHFVSESATGESIGRATLRYSPLTDLTIESGGEIAYNYLSGKTSFFVNGVNQPLPSAIAYVNEKRGEIFAQGTWKLAPEWLLEAGARAEFSTISETGSVSLSRSFFYPKPRAVLTWSPDSNTQVRVRYEKVVGQLDFNNFIASANLSATGVTVGNENLRPDQHSQYEISLERHFWEKGAAVLTFMHEEIKDVIDLVPVTSGGTTFDAPGNIGTGQNNQIFTSLTLPLDRFFLPNGLLKGRATFDLTSVRDPVTHTNRVISAQRAQDIHVTLTQDIDSLKSTWGIFYYNGWDERSYRLAQFRHREVTAPYFGVWWDYKPSPSWLFHIESDNVTGYDYKDLKLNYSGPRNAASLSNIDFFESNTIPYVEIQIRYTF